MVLLVLIPVNIKNKSVMLLPFRRETMKNYDNSCCNFIRNFPFQQMPMYTGFIFSITNVILGRAIDFFIFIFPFILLLGIFSSLSCLSCQSYGIVLSQAVGPI